MSRNFHRLSVFFQLHNIWQDYYTRILTFKCSQELSRILVLKTMYMHAKHVLYLRTLLRTLQNGIGNINLLIKNLSRPIRKNLGSFMGVSTLPEHTI